MLSKLISAEKRTRTNGEEFYVCTFSYEFVKTFSEASKIVEREGATEIYAVSSHGLFVKGAVELLDQAPIKEILVTDSVAPNGPTPKNINYLTASELIAEAIVRIQERKPVSPLFAYHKK